MNETILIVGDSPFLGEVEGKLHYLLEKYPSIGINHAIAKYNVGIHIFQDIRFIELTNQYPEVKTVAPAWYGDMVQKENKELIGSYPFIFGEDTEHDIIKDGELAWCGFTHDYAISYCIMKGYKNIILIGAADFTGNSHYLTKEEFRYSEKLKEQSKKYIEEICSKRANIYTCNPQSILNIPIATIESVLNETFS
jgi:hypothetical protein